MGLDSLFSSDSTSSSPLGGTGLSGDLSSALNLVGLQNAIKSNKAAPAQLPWEKSAVDSPFFKSIKILGERWDQLFPYRLLVIDALAGNKIVNGGNPSGLKISVDQGTTSPLVTFEAFGSQWIFQLPITPQQFSMVDPWAINVGATLKGINEEHGGARFKLISASGTMGVWPQRPNVVKPPESPSPIASIFGGTISAAQNLVGQFNGLINTISTGHPATAQDALRPENDGNSGFGGTGYYQALALQQFLEQYAEAKRNPANAGWRLVLDIPKQNQSFVVTPMPFTWSQNANKPLEINYQIQFKAWRRINLNENVTNKKSDVQPLSPGVMAKILNSISQARNVLSASISLIGAVRSDIETPLEALRQTGLFIKQLAGAVVMAADLPAQLQKDLKSTIADFMANTNQDFKALLTDDTARSNFNTIVAMKASSEGLSSTAVSGGQLGTGAAQLNSIDPAQAILNDPNANYALMSLVPVASLTLTPAQQDSVDTILTDSRETTVDDLKGWQATIQQLSTQFAGNFGAGSSFYSKVYNQPAPTPRIVPMTLDEFDILKALYDALSGYGILTATQQIDYLNKQTNMDYVAGLATASDIPFQTSQSKLLVPVPFGVSVEGIALRYLGDAQRWLEIVTLNNLRAPYIDEDGFQISLLSNATGRQITVGSIENLYIGQRILLQSATQSPTARQILSIDTLSSTSSLLTLDGLANLDNYLISDRAYIQAYLPGTVNSQQKIFIPSNLPSSQSLIVNPAASLSDPLTGLSKVDLLLTDGGDLAVNNFGDFRLSYGLTNIIQALKIKIGTIKGTLLTHPDFGLGIRAGIMNSDTNTKQVFDGLNKLIQADPRFDGIDTLQVTMNGPVLAINMAVKLAGQQGVFPINFNVQA